MQTAVIEYFQYYLQLQGFLADFAPAFSAADRVIVTEVQILHCYIFFVHVLSIDT